MHLKGNYRPEHPHFLLFSFFFFERDSVCLLPSYQACGGSDGSEMGFLEWWQGQEGTCCMWSHSDPSMGYKGGSSQIPHLGSSTGCGNGWPPPMYPHHHRGQSPSNKSSTPSKVIIDKGWHANVDTEEIILWGQSLLLSCFWRGTPCLMYKYCGGTLFPYLLSDYKRNGVETIRDAGSHVSFL